MSHEHGTLMHKADIHGCPTCKAAYAAGRGVGKIIAAERKAEGQTRETVHYYALTLPATVRRVGILAGIADVYNGETI